ncbi:endonuclease/exonuclease/phosphatase family protein [Actinomadura sp. 7K507]|uniref:endonuclease/exonuclease/phosphatase family protein n=1 Tax=Actinomadura sp. 7K507 TaxID=2530365 RepID=UPI00104EBDB2|nr:endonuclease/exonuclease/phosphatase family protein [Actinomadura sp. 7K507]TDC75529.1 endonuclease/exonuclease/phosphatase family protein [Actinomadura sp. 7K507]
MKLTFAIWNTLDGGSDTGSDARLRRQMALLATFAPTVVGLQECKHWDRDYFRTFHLAEQLLGMRGFLRPSAHHGCHLAIFIREDAGLTVIEQRHEYGHPYWHGAARIVVQADGHPPPVQLASIHLAPSSPVIRLAEAEALGLIAKEHPAIIGGDFNALPARDPEPRRVEGRSRRKLDRRPAQALEEAGFIDVGAHTKDTTPTVGHDSELPYRCDRIYTTLPAGAITGHQIITSADNESDHRPVIAEFDLANTTRDTQTTSQS